MVEEMWKSQEAMERHLRSDNHRKVLLVAEMATEAPEIHFRTVTQSAGLEIIENSEAWGESDFQLRKSQRLWSEEKVEAQP